MTRSIATIRHALPLLVSAFIVGACVTTLPGREATDALVAAVRAGDMGGAAP